ncbi:MAG: T9SS type A sorting domain-containing protein [Bacteroidetes bacterium]|nr:T9SS type A sorting domain-containing protein [Bacteroidota bacterium]
MRTLLFTLSFSCLVLFVPASDITLSIGDVNAACTASSPGDKIYVPITIDYITPGEEIAGFQFFIWFDQDIITWDGAMGGGGGPALGINYLSPIWPPFLSCSDVFNVNIASELVWLWGDGMCYLSLAGQTLPHLLVEFIFTYHGGIVPGDFSPLIWGTSGKSSVNTNGKGTTEVHTWDEFDYFSLTLNNGSIYFPACLNSFHGTINNDWFEPGNWCFGCVPDNTNVWIEPLPLNSPVISGGTALVDDIYLFEGALLTIAPDGGLTVNGSVENEGQLIIQSDNEGNSGTLITNESISGTGIFGFHRNLFCSGTTPGSTDPFGWHYLSAPFEGFSTDIIPDYFVNAWDQTTGNWIHYDGSVIGPCMAYPSTYLNPLDAWSINLDFTYPDPNCFPPLPPGTGDQVEFFASASQVHSGDYTKNLGYGSTGYQMWNMVGNPFPAGLDVNTLVWGPNIIRAVYLYDGCLGNYAYWAEGMGPYIIPPTQGFFIETTGPDVFWIGDESRAHNPNLILKSKVADLLTIRSTGNGKTDILHIRFADNVTPGFDKNGDAHKLFAETDGLPQFYTLAGDERLAINALPETEFVPMGFSANGSGTFYLEAIETSEFETVILEDLFSGVQTDLLVESYSFNYNSGDDPERFMIHFEPGISEPESKGISVWSSGKTVFIVADGASGEIMIYNVVGQMVHASKLKSIPTNRIETSNLQGYFIVKVKTDDFACAQKVFIR